MSTWFLRFSKSADCLHFHLKVSWLFTSFIFFYRSLNNAKRTYTQFRPWKIFYNFKVIWLLHFQSHLIVYIFKVSWLFTLLSFFLQVAQQCKENIYAIQTLKDFQYLDDNKDQGINVREKAKSLVALLKDDERLRNERVRALKAKERFAQSAAGIGSDTVVSIFLAP